MPIQVSHGPSMGLYGGVVADSARRQGQQDNDKDFAQFMMELQGQNRDYELGGRATAVQEGQLALSDEQLQHQKYIDVENLGLQQRQLDLETLLGMSDIELQKIGLSLQERNMVQQLKIAEMQNQTNRDTSSFLEGRKRPESRMPNHYVGPF